jgi:hypothetical protein
LEGSGADIVGFYATRFHKAPNEIEAINSATKSMQREWSKSPYKDANSGEVPRLTTDTIEKVGFLDFLLGTPRSGFTFYADEH